MGHDSVARSPVLESSAGTSSCRFFAMCTAALTVVGRWHVLRHGSCSCLKLAHCFVLHQRSVSVPRATLLTLSRAMRVLMHVAVSAHVRLDALAACAHCCACAVAVQLLCSCCAVVVQLLCSACAVFVQSSAGNGSECPRGASLDRTALLIQSEGKANRQHFCDGFPLSRVPSGAFLAQIVDCYKRSA